MLTAAAGVRTRRTRPESVVIDPTAVVVEGWMLKTDPGGREWSERWFRLRNRVVEYACPAMISMFSHSDNPFFYGKR